MGVLLGPEPPQGSQEQRGSTRLCGRSIEKFRFGDRLGLGAHFYPKFKTLNSPKKLRRIILLHIGVVTFRFHFPKIREVLIFMIFGPGGRVDESQQQLLLLLLLLLVTLDTPELHKTNKENTNAFQEHISFANINIMEIGKIEKTRAETF